jgi:hypothetical protein
MAVTLKTTVFEKAFVPENRQGTILTFYNVRKASVTCRSKVKYQQVEKQAKDSAKLHLGEIETAGEVLTKGHLTSLSGISPQSSEDFVFLQRVSYPIREIRL